MAVLQSGRKSHPSAVFTDYYGLETMSPVINLTAVTYRDAPILQGTLEGAPPGESTSLRALVSRIETTRFSLWPTWASPGRTAPSPTPSPMVPGYARCFRRRDCRSRTCMSCRCTAWWYRSKGRGGAGVAHGIIKTLKERRGRGYLQYAFIVGEDIDISSVEDVFWCLTTRLHPKYGIHVDARAGAIGSPPLPNLMPDERENHYSYTAYFDCTWPTSWSEEYLLEHTRVVDFARAWPKDVQERVLRRWKEYGLD